MDIKKQFIRYVSQNMLGMLGMSLYILADTYFISKAVGADGIIDVFSDSVNDHGINKQKYRKTGNILLPALR